MCKAEAASLAGAILVDLDLKGRVWPGAGRPVVALHCSLAHSGAWTGVAERLSGVSLVAPDLPGHGQAAPWDGVSDLHDVATAQTRALVEALARQAGQGIDLLGHSFGATIALRLAVERTDLVRSLTLIEPPLFCAVADHPGSAEHLAMEREIAAHVPVDRYRAAEAFHGLWGAGVPLRDCPPRIRDYIAERIHLIPAQGSALMEDRPGLLAPGALERVEVPALLLQGSESPAVADAILSALAARLPRVHRASVPGARHMLPVTHAPEVARLVQAHLDHAQGGA